LSGHGGALLLASGQVHVETVRVLYGETTFYFASMEVFLAWMGRRSGTQLQRIRRIRVGWNWWSHYRLPRESAKGEREALRVTERLPSLSTLDVTEWITFALMFHRGTVAEVVKDAKSLVSLRERSAVQVVVDLSAAEEKLQRRAEMDPERDLSRDWGTQMR